MERNNEWTLLARRRFGPFFITQFFGALNDNLFKNALMLLLVFSSSVASFNDDALINLCAVLFIVPFFIFSAFAGQLADKFAKTQLIVLIKIADLFLVLLALCGFYYHNLFILLLALFLFGTQATFFSPIKYSILPQQLKETELLAGNGFIEMGTFIAILVGNILGGLLIGIPNSGIFWVSITMTLVAMIGLASCLFIPKVQALDPHLKLDWNPFRQTFVIIKDSCQDKKLFYAILGISWFWLYGSIFLTQIPNYTKLTLNGNEFVATLLLVFFSTGIGVGSSLCNWLSNQKIEIGFVLLGAFGLSLFAIDMALIQIPSSPTLLAAKSFILSGHNWRILCDAFLIGGFGGLYLVPLYTLLQKYSQPEQCARVIAANNIINAVFMVGASMIAVPLLNWGFTIPQLFILTALLNGIMGLYLLKLNKLMKFAQTPLISHTASFSIKS